MASRLAGVESLTHQLERSGDPITSEPLESLPKSIVMPKVVPVVIDSASAT